MVFFPNCRNTKSESCPFCRGSLKRVNSEDLWVLTCNDDVVDNETVSKEDLLRFYLYVNSLPKDYPDALFLVYYEYLIWIEVNTKSCVQTTDRKADLQFWKESGKEILWDFYTEWQVLNCAYFIITSISLKIVFWSKVNFLYQKIPVYVNNVLKLQYNAHWGVHIFSKNSVLFFLNSNDYELKICIIHVQNLASYVPTYLAPWYLWFYQALWSLSNWCIWRLSLFANFEVLIMCLLEFGIWVSK